MGIFKKSGFECLHCRREVPTRGPMGTRHRNHCPHCLWSRHLDRQKSGDRTADCGGPMRPIGLTFKREGADKYGRPRQGEIMLIHECEDCGRLSINRLAADDGPNAVLEIFENSFNIEEDLKEKIIRGGIALLGENDRQEIRTQLFGKSFGTKTLPKAQ